MEARRHVEFTEGSGLAALGGSGLAMAATRRGRTMRKGGIGLATWLGGSGHMTERGQQHATPSRAGNRVSSVSCLAGLAAERYA
jgi:hypothetical protein